MNFGEALNEVFAGKEVTRTGWGIEGSTIFAKDGKLMYRERDGGWNQEGPSTNHLIKANLVAEDWVVYEGKPKIFLRDLAIGIRFRFVFPQSKSDTFRVVGTRSFDKKMVLNEDYNLVIEYGENADREVVVVK